MQVPILWLDTSTNQDPILPQKPRSCITRLQIVA